MPAKTQNTERRSSKYKGAPRKPEKKPQEKKPAFAGNLLRGDNSKKSITLW
jgi:hypothetical protein